MALYLFPYSRALNNPNERTRVLQTRALVEHAQLHIGDTFVEAGRLRVRDLYGSVFDFPFVNDVALVCADPRQRPPLCVGKIYPAKAPGTALLGVPALALARAAGFVPDGVMGEPRATWVVRYGGVAVFFLLGLWVLGRELAAAGADVPLVERVVLAAGLGTSAFAYGINFVGHTISGTALLGGLALVRLAAERRGAIAQATAAMAGLVSGSAVLLEYHAAVAVAASSIWMLCARWRRTLVPGFALGGAAALAVHSLLHVRMFGSPLRTGHFFLMTEHNRQYQSAGFLGIDGLHAAALRDNLFDPYMGLVPLMPWLALGLLLGSYWLLRPAQPSATRALCRAALAMTLTYLVFVSTLGHWRVMNGWSMGPRYLTPVVLPMALVAGYGWWRTSERYPSVGRVIAGLASASVAMVLALSAAYPSPPDVLRNPFAELVPDMLLKGYAVRNVLMSWGSVSILVLGLLVAVTVCWLALGRDRSDQRPSLRWSWALLVAALWVGGWACIRPSSAAQRAAAVAFCRATLEGVTPAGQGGFFQ